MPYTADRGITRAMPPQLAVAKRRVRRMELKLHQVRHEAALLRQYLEGAVGPNEAILLKRHLSELDARAAKMESKLASSYQRLFRAPRPRRTKAAPMPVSTETASEANARQEQLVSSIAQSTA